MTATSDFMMNVGGFIAVIIVIMLMGDAVIFAVKENKRMIAHQIAKETAFAILEAYEKGRSSKNLTYGGKIRIEKGVVFAEVGGEKDYFPYPLEINASGRVNGTAFECERRYEGIRCEDR